MICGVPEIDVEDFKLNCRFTGGLYKESKTVKMFFNVISKWDRESLAKLLMFITGSSQVPIGGFRSFSEMGMPITINCSGNDNSRLPVSHTCTNTLDLPNYTNEKELESKLSFSITECNTFEIA